MKKSLVSMISWLLVIAMMASMPLAAFADEPLPMKATVTVSYTHLRAHET